MLIHQLNNLTPAGKALLAKVKSKDLELAWKRYWMLFPEKKSASDEAVGSDPLAASLRAKWLSRYQEAEAMYGDGILGLIQGRASKAQHAPATSTHKAVRLPNPAQMREGIGGVSATRLCDQSAAEVRAISTGGIITRKGNITRHRMGD